MSLRVALAEKFPEAPESEILKVKQPRSCFSKKYKKFIRIALNKVLLLLKHFSKNGFQLNVVDGWSDFQLSVIKPKPDAITLGNHSGRINARKQRDDPSEFEATACNRAITVGNWYGRVTFGLGRASHWPKKWEVICEPITECSKANADIFRHHVNSPLLELRLNPYLRPVVCKTWCNGSLCSGCRQLDLLQIHEPCDCGS